MQDKILESMKNIAVIGFSPDANKDSHKVGQFLISRGYNVYAVYPKSFEIGARQSVPSISDIADDIDTVVVFRKASAVNEIYEQIKAKGVKNLWLQLGIKNDEVGAKAHQDGITFNQNACIMIELLRKEK